MAQFITFRRGDFYMLPEKEITPTMCAIYGIWYEPAHVFDMDVEDAISRFSFGKNPNCFDPNLGKFCEELEAAVIGYIQGRDREEGTMARLFPEYIPMVPNPHLPFSHKVVLDCSTLVTKSPDESYTERAVSVMHECGLEASGRNGRGRGKRFVPQRPMGRGFKPGKKPKLYKILIFRGNGMPEEFITNLTYRDIAQVRNSAGNGSTSWRYQINALTLTDPAQNSPIPNYVTVFSVAYAFYRVEAFKATFKFSNQEAFELSCACFLQGSGVDPGANSASALTFSQNDNARNCQLGVLTGQSRGNLTYPWTLLTDLIPGQAKFDDNYAAAVGSTPTAAIYLPVSVYTTAGAVVLVAGVAVEAIIHFRVKFYGKKLLAT